MIPRRGVVVSLLHMCVFRDPFQGFSLSHHTHTDRDTHARARRAHGRARASLSLSFACVAGRLYFFAIRRQIS